MNNLAVKRVKNYDHIDPMLKSGDLRADGTVIVHGPCLFSTIYLSVFYRFPPFYHR